MKKITLILLFLVSKAYAQNVTTVNLGSGNVYYYYTNVTVSEQKIYYRGEFYWNHGLNTSTGAFTSDAAKDISDYLPIEASTSITISSQDSSDITIYGWTYDASYTAISEIRSNALISSKLKTYTFTTPSNAAYIAVYTKASNDSFHLRLRINSTNNVTYNSPVIPEQYTGTPTEKIQKAVNFARWTSSAVFLNGVYGLDSSIIPSSGSKIILNNGRIFMNVGMHDNVFRNEAVANPSNIMHRGNRDISIIGLGNAVIEGSKERWGSSYPTPTPGFQEYWRANAILLANVDIFTIKGLTFKSLNASAIVPELSRNGIVSDLTFLDGWEHQNQGGIIIGRGCYNIQVSNFTGTCFDDMVAIQNIPDYLGSYMYILGTTTNYLPYAYNKNLDVFGIKVSNINRSVSAKIATGPNSEAYFGGAIRLLAASGVIHDVSIDNVSGYQNILIQNPSDVYGVQDANKIYNLSVSNTGNAPIYINRAIRNSSFINVAKKDTSGTYNSVSLKDSSLSIYRQYRGEAPEFIDSVYSGIEHKRTLN